MDVKLSYPITFEAAMNVGFHRFVSSPITFEIAGSSLEWTPRRAHGLPPVNEKIPGKPAIAVYNKIVKIIYFLLKNLK